MLVAIVIAATVRFQLLKSIINHSFNIMEAFFNNLLHDLRRNCSISVDGKGCLEWNGALTDSGYGRKRISWPDGKKRIERVHRVAFMAYYHITPPDLMKTNEYGEQIDVSHICNNKKCILKEHLVLEPHVSNMNRNECFRRGFCTKVHIPYCVV